VSFRAGDTIRHLPSGEEWLLACDEEDGRVVCCGWPETQANAKDCILVEAATDKERISTLSRVAESCSGQMRGRRAMRQLNEVQP
jgi:hypothetical protein